MKRFKIAVNGFTYMVEVEQVEEVQGTGGEEAGSDRSPKNPAALSPSPRQAVRKGNGGVKAPMPGVITDIRVKVGDQITENQTIMILEAMKMENEITPGKHGTVKEILVSSGQTVAAGDLLIVIE